MHSSFVTDESFFEITTQFDDRVLARDRQIVDVDTAVRISAAFCLLVNKRYSLASVHVHKDEIWFCEQFLNILLLLFL